MALHPETKHGKNNNLGPSGQFAETIGGFTKNAAERLGFDERTIRRSIRRHEALHPEIRRRLAGTWLADHGQQLDHLAAIPKSEQLAVVEALFGEDEKERPKTVHEAIDRLRGVHELSVNKDDAKFAVFDGFWRRCSSALKRRIHAHISKEKL